MILVPPAALMVSGAAPSASSLWNWTSYSVVLSFVTETVQVTCLPPSWVTAVMTVVPAAIPVTSPFWSTVAAVSSEEVQFTFLFVAFSGNTSASSWNVFPSAMRTDWSFSVIELTATVSDTVTLHFADIFPIFAVMVAEPFAMAVTSPSFTSATFSLELLHTASAAEISDEPV